MKKRRLGMFEMSGMRKAILIMGISMMAALAGCAGSEVREDLNEAVDVENIISENDISENIAEGQQEEQQEEQSEEPEENISDSQPVVPVDDREIVCENPYFFPRNVTVLTADITFEDDRGFTTISNELELYWLKQYDNGCLARLSIAPFDNTSYYLDIEYFNMYFYVTPNEIYRIDYFVDSVDSSFDNMDIYINYNDSQLMTILNTDEKLMEYGELIACLQEIRDGLGSEEGTHILIRQEGEQITYARIDVTPYNIGFWEDYTWENGMGLVEYRRGFRAERDPLYIENIVFND